MNTDQPMIEVKELTKHYGDVVALDGVTFSVFEATTAPARRRRSAC